VTRTCSWATEPTWELVEPLTSLNSPQSEVDPFLTADRLRIYFTSGRSGVAAVYEAVRAGPDQPFQAPTVVPLSGMSNGGALRITPDGLVAVAVGDSGQGPHSDVFLSERTATDQPFPPFQKVDNVNSSGNEFDPFLTADRLSLWLVSDRTGTQEIHLATRTSPGGSFSPATRVEELRGSPGAGDGNPILTDDQRVIVLATEGDLWYATRASAQEPFGAPQQIAGLVTADYDWEPAITGDGCHLVFGRNNDIYGVSMVPQN
jgi:Tol biopolymer transport system component